MGSGKLGDHPITDLLIHGRQTLPQDICDLILEIHQLDPDAFEYEDVIRMQGRPTLDVRNYGDWFAWKRGEELDQARSFLARKLEFALQVQTITDPVAEQLATRVREEFPQWLKYEQSEKRSYNLNYPDPSRAGKRIKYSVFSIPTENPNSFSCLSLYTFPDAEFYWLNNLVQRYPSGEVQYVLDFLHDMINERIVIKEFCSQHLLLGQLLLDSSWSDSLPIGELVVKSLTWRRDL